MARASVSDGRIIACDSVEALSRTNTKRITLRGQVDLQNLKGIRNRQDVDGTVSFLFGGNINELIRILSTGKVADLTVTEPDLEEVFLHYYEKDGNA